MKGGKETGKEGGSSVGWRTETITNEIREAGLKWVGHNTKNIISTAIAPHCPGVHRISFRTSKITYISHLSLPSTCSYTQSGLPDKFIILLS